MNDQEFQEWIEGAFQAPAAVAPEDSELTLRVLQRLDAQRRLRLASLTTAALTGAVCAALLLRWLLPADAAAIAASTLQSLAHEVGSVGPGSIFGLSGVLLVLAGLRAFQKI
jgi:hypothetical protein